MSFKGTLIRTLNRHVLHRWRLALRKDGQDDDNYVLTPFYQDRLVEGLSGALALFVERARLGSGADSAPLAAIVRDFIALYRRRPVRDNTGGCGFTGSLSLYLVARLVEPTLVVESGTWQGHSSWLLAEACPGAALHSFDIEHDNLLHRDPRVTYHRCDWLTYPIEPADPSQSLIFFDDHVSHARRLKEAHGRGFRMAMFDDDLTVDSLFVTGMPPAPTVAMLMDPDMGPGQSVEWVYRGRHHRFRMDEDVAEARALIAECHRLPDLSGVSHYRSHHGMSFVRLID